MNNELNTGSLETLTTGKCLLVDARIVKNGKVSLHFAEVINTGSQPSQDEDQIDLLAHSMRYDESFSGGAQRRWLTTTVQAATEDYGIDFTDMNTDWYNGPKGRQMDLNILNPFNIVQNRYVKVSIQETIVPSKWQADNIETTCKTRGKGGDPITYKGDYIWRNTIAVGVPSIDSPVKHVLLESDPVGVKLVEQEQVELTTESMVGELESNDIGL
jgi:hypothetical protein